MNPFRKFVDILNKNVGPKRFDNIVQLPESWVTLMIILSGCLVYSLLIAFCAILTFKLPIYVLIYGLMLSVIGLYVQRMSIAADRRHRERQFHERLDRLTSP